MRYAAVVVALVLAGCGGDRMGASAVVPRDAGLYLSIDLRPGGEGRDLARALGTGTPGETLLWVAGLGAAQEELDPWLGDRGAVFTWTAGDGAPEVGLALASRDDDAARAFARDAADGGRFTASAIVEGHQVLGSSEEVVGAARRAADGDGIPADGEEGTAAFASLDANALRSHLPLRALDAGGMLLSLLPTDARTTVRIEADRRAVVAEIHGFGEPYPRPPDIDAVPSAAWLMVSTGDVGRAATALLAAQDQISIPQIETAAGIDLEADLLAHLGAGWAFVQGTRPTDTGARLLVETGDEAALRRSLTTVARSLRRAGAIVEINRNRPGADPFFQLSLVMPDGLSLFAEVEPGRLTVEAGEAVDGVAGDLVETDGFREAARRLGGTPTAYVDLATAAELTGQPSLALGGSALALRDLAVGGRRVIRLAYLR